MGAHRKRTHETLPFYTAPYVAPQSPTREGGPRWAMLALPREAWKPIPGGCCCRSSATAFTAAERVRCNLPLGGEWEQEPPRAP